MAAILDVGVDVPGYIAAAAAAGGVVLSAVIGVVLCFWLIRCGLRWMRDAECREIEREQAARDWADRESAQQYNDQVAKHGKWDGT